MSVCRPLIRVALSFVGGLALTTAAYAGPVDLIHNGSVTATTMSSPTRIITALAHSGATVTSLNGGNLLAADGAFPDEPITPTFIYAGARRHGDSGQTSEALNVTLNNETFETPVLQNVNHGSTNVPEPGTWGMLMPSLAGMFLVAWSRTRRKATASGAGRRANRAPAVCFRACFSAGVIPFGPNMLQQTKVFGSLFKKGLLADLQFQPQKS